MHALYLFGFLRASSLHKEYDMSYNIQLCKKVDWEWD